MSRTLYKDIHKTKGMCQDAPLKFFRPRRQSNPEKAAATFLSTSVGDQECIIDRGASLHFVDKSSPSLKTVTKSDTLCLFVTANRTVETDEKATVYIKDLEVFLCVKLVENFPAVLSLGMLCEKMAPPTRGQRESSPL